MNGSKSAIESNADGKTDNVIFSKTRTSGTRWSKEQGGLRLAGFSLQCRTAVVNDGEFVGRDGGLIDERRGLLPLLAANDLGDGDKDNGVVPLATMHAAHDLKLSIPLGRLAENRFERGERIDRIGIQRFRERAGRAAAKLRRGAAQPAAALLAIRSAGRTIPLPAADERTQRELDRKHRPVLPGTRFAGKPGTIVADDQMMVQKVNQEAGEQVDSH